MKRREFLAAAGAAPSAVAASQAGAGDGFTALFDGATLAGWTVRDGAEGDFRVREGWIESPSWASPHAWLRSEREYENFDFQCEFYIEAWMEGGIYLHAPEYGRNTWVGMMIKIFRAPELAENSIGAIFPLVRPLKAVVRNRGDWNRMRILMDWPRLNVWINGETVQDLDVESVPELRHRLRRGYLGLTGLATPLRFRNLRIRPLPSREKWEPLFETDGDLEKWEVVPESPRTSVKFTASNGILRSTGLGNLVTREKFRDFELLAYIRAAPNSNGGVFFRTDGKGLAGRYYEIQVFNVPDAHNITGSLYGYARGVYPHVEDEKWFPFQLWVRGSRCVVRVNGDTVLEYNDLKYLEEGHIELQQHRMDRWMEYQRIRIKRLDSAGRFT